MSWSVPQAVPSRARWVLGGVVVCMGAAGLALLYLVDPAQSSFLPSCLFHELTGLHCPGCGSTRALHDLLHGRLAGALGHNLLMVLSLPVLGYAVLGYGLEWLTGRRLPAPRARWWWGFTVLAVIVLFGVARNLPFAPFNALAP